MHPCWRVPRFILPGRPVFVSRPLSQEILRYVWAPIDTSTPDALIEEMDAARDEQVSKEDWKVVAASLRLYGRLLPLISELESQGFFDEMIKRVMEWEEKHPDDLGW